MRKIAFFLTAITLASCGQSGNKTAQTDSKTTDSKTSDVKTSAAAAPADWKTYTHNTISVQYPATWKIDGSETRDYFTLSSPMDSSGAVAAINLTSQETNGAKIDLESSVQQATERLKNYLTNFTLVSSKKVTDAQGDYEQLIYTGEQSSLKLGFEQRYRIIKDKIYVLSLSCLYSSWDKSQQIGEQIMNTFTVKN